MDNKDNFSVQAGFAVAVNFSTAEIFSTHFYIIRSFLLKKLLHFCSIGIYCLFSSHLGNNLHFIACKKNIDYTEWFTERTNGKIQINSTAIYRYLSLEVVERLDSSLSVNEIIDWIRNKTREAFSSIYGKNPEVGALNSIALKQNFKLVDGTYLSARKTDLIPLVEAAIIQ